MTAPLTPKRRAELRRVAHDSAIHRQRMREAGLNVGDTGFTPDILLALLDAADERDRLAAEADDRGLLPDGGKA